MMTVFPLIGKVDVFDAVVLANGEFPIADEPLALLHKAPFVCACDGAASSYPDADVYVGDGDSVPPALRERLILVTEQEDNDLTKATRYCVAHGMRKIVYLGASGGREDHLLGNVSLMVRYALEMGVEPLMATDSGWFVVAQGECRFESFTGQQVSIFNVSCTQLCSEHLKWDAYPYTQAWQGTLNEASTDDFVLRGNGAYIIYRTYSPKTNS